MNNPSRNRLPFAEVTFESLGKVKILILTPSGVTKIIVDVDVLDEKITEFLGMYVIDP